MVRSFPVLPANEEKDLFDSKQRENKTLYRQH